MALYVKDMINYFNEKVYYTAKRYYDTDKIEITYAKGSTIRGIVEDDEVEINLDDIMNGKYKDDSSAYEEAVLCLKANERRGYGFSDLFFDDSYSAKDMSIIFIELVLKDPTLLIAIPSNLRGAFDLPLISLLQNHPELVNEVAGNGEFCGCLFELVAHRIDLINEIAKDDQALNNIMIEYEKLENK